MDIPFAGSLLGWYVRQRSRKIPIAPRIQRPLAETHRVLLVLTTGIGDAVFSSAVFPALRAAMPHAKIALFCRSGWTELFVADPALNEVIPYPGKFRKFFGTLKALKSFRPELVLVLHGNDPDVIPLCYLAGAESIVRIPVEGTRYDYLLSNRLRSEDRNSLPGIHYVDNRLRILDTLGIPKGTGVPQLHIDATRRRTAQEELATLLNNRPYWVVHPRAADSYKSLPDDLLISLIREARRVRPDHCVVVTGGDAEKESLAARLAPLADEGALCAAGRWSLADTAACLVGASAVIAPDTGILHIAAALGRPVIGLYAPTRVALVGPRSRSAPALVIEKPLTCQPCYQKRCPHLPVKCMSQFDAADIVEKLVSILGRAS